MTERQPLLVAAGLVWRPGDVLVVQRRRADAGHGAGHWELPGGKLEPAEHPRDALARELMEEWGPVACGLRVGPVADVLHHVYPPPGPRVLLIVYHVDAGPLAAPGIEPLALGLRPEPGVELGAFSRAELPVEEFLAADRQLLVAIRDGLLGPPAWSPAGSLPRA
ncbi:NUDIX domain-containing protein [Paraliomyxa miuraensis]|uniref:NUDIX domain-containing protein n=1 Tax=Paraliomyxa miuraensis TaxID=376150 RepID=UPI00224F8C4C|nr:NUDIX domain-containing protein [Paraliomyxa miuraensis]MCX4245693.1 NUDIX domain-containing protein [Paraliomyxa miuraensis]